ncbi:hypothetical protein [Paenibacillus sp. MBLB4367]|uniref:hypothetical protein n=1 Tax=Paenibacillus sp. MBLB4367 TaxID=3384767 RepID=UPI0039081DE5
MNGKKESKQLTEELARFIDNVTAHASTDHTVQSYINDLKQIFLKYVACGKEG